MDKYLMFMKKVLDLKEDIENKIVEGKRKGYIFKTYKLGTNEFKVVDGLIIETKIIDNRFEIGISTYHFENGEEIENYGCPYINITNKTCDIGGITTRFENAIDVKNVYLCSTNKTIKNRIIDLDSIEKAIIIKAFIKDYKENYIQYLETDHWKSVRENKLKEANYKCQLCSKKDIELHVHHNTYENIGNEEMNDLIVLCKYCHSRFHNI